MIYKYQLATPFFPFFSSYIFRYVPHLRTSTEHISTPLADEGNYEYCQSRGAQNIKDI